MSTDKNNAPHIGALVLAGIAVGAILYEIFRPNRAQTIKKKVSRSKKRVFISFASEDVVYRDHLVNQARDKRSLF